MTLGVSDPVGPGTDGRLVFDADRPGRFAVTLRDANRRIGTIDIKQPRLGRGVTARVAAARRLRVVVGDEDAGAVAPGARDLVRRAAEVRDQRPVPRHGARGRGSVAASPPWDASAAMGAMRLAGPAMHIVA